MITLRHFLFLLSCAVTAVTPCADAAAQVTVPFNITVATGSSNTILPAYNNVSANWQMAGMQSVGGIPNRTTICATLNTTGGNDQAAIQAAIDNCPSGQVVQLGVGRFNIDINDTGGRPLNIARGVTLRGCTNASNCSLSRETDSCSASSGTTQNATVGVGANFTGSPYCLTVLFMTNGATVSGGPPTSPIQNPGVAMGLTYPVNTGFNTQTALTADAAQGATSVQVASTNGLAVGQIILIDELTNESFTPDPSVATGGSSYPNGEQIWAAPDWPNTTGASTVNGVSSATGRSAWQFHNPTVTGDDGTSLSSPGPICWFNRCDNSGGTCNIQTGQNCADRNVAEIHKIAAISGNTVTFDDPLMIAYRQSGGHNAVISLPVTAFVQNAGLENLTIVGATNGGVVFNFCAYCWVKGVEISLWYGGAVQTMYTFRTQLEQNMFHHNTWNYSSGAEYTLDMKNSTTELYAVNNIDVLGGKCMAERAAGAGTVIAYNYCDKAMGFPPSWQEMGVNGSHTSGSHHTLFEGNWTHNMDNDSTHGAHFYHTYFRNLSTSIRTPFMYYIPGQSKSGYTINDANNNVGAGNCDGHGNGCGPIRAAGQQQYNYWHAFVGNVLGTSGVTTAGNGFVLSGSFPTNNSTIWYLGWFDVNPYRFDGNVATRTFRHGNYDYFDNSIQWDPNTSNHTLPNSLYLTSAPAFFSTGSGYTWPWINPTGTPQFYTLPAKARFDAGTPFVQP
jgi:hypothetical protein